MPEFPSYYISLADETHLTLTSTDEHAATLLAQFASAAQLALGNRSDRRVIVTTDESKLSLKTIDGTVYQFIPIPNGKFNFPPLFGLSHVITRQTQDGILLHGALAEHKGRGVIMIAPGGTGKTTASERLPSPWRSLSDDLSLILRDRQGTYWAHPWPTWSRFKDDGPGGSWKVQSGVPLQAIFHLSQAEKDWLEPLGIGEAVIFLIQSAEQVFSLIKRAFDKDYIRRLRLEQFDRLCVLARSVPINKLHLSLDGSFWQVMEEAMEKRLEEHG